MRALVLCLALAGCAAVPQPPALPDGGTSPAEVTLYRDTLTVRMRDGTLCTGVRSARAGPWRTALAGCPHRWPVAVERVSDRPRLPLVARSDDPWVTLAPPDGPLLRFGPSGRAPGA